MGFTLPSKEDTLKGFMRKMVMDWLQNQCGFNVSHLLPLAKKSLTSDEN